MPFLLIWTVGPGTANAQGRPIVNEDRLLERQADVARNKSRGFTVISKFAYASGARQAYLTLEPDTVTSET